MGMFDSVVIVCPMCGCEVEFQSKAGKCELKRYDPESVPPEIAVDLNGAHESCCGECYTLTAPIINRVRMVVYTGELKQWD